MLNYPNELIQLGYNNAKILKQIKTRLNELGYGPLTPDIPNFGVTTMEVVMKFQKDRRLVADGVIGDLTWRKLFNIPFAIPEDAIGTLGIEAIKVALSQLHVREKTNHNDGIYVEKYLGTVGLGKGYSWCMAFVYWDFAQAAKNKGIVCPVPKTAGVLDCYAKAKEYRIYKPKMGSQFIMDFGKGAGHTGIVTAVKGDRIHTVEGNTSADPSYAGEDREGNGVFERSRLISTIKGFLYYN